MPRSRTLILVGGGITALAVDMIVGVPWFVSWALLMAGLFLLAWGVAPIAVMRGVAALPMGARLTHGLNEFNRWIVGATSSQESLDRLSYKMDEGLRILNRIVNSEEALIAWEKDDEDWTAKVFSEIETNFSRPQAVTFRSVGSVLAANFLPAFNNKHNTRKLHLDKRLDNLRHFLDAESNKL
jgi:hypothetical protein